MIKLIQENHLYHLWKISHSQENPEWKQWDAPYFNDYKQMTYIEFYQRYSTFLKKSTTFWHFC